MITNVGSLPKECEHFDEFVAKSSEHCKATVKVYKQTIDVVPWDWFTKGFDQAEKDLDLLSSYTMLIKKFCATDVDKN